MTIRRPSGSWVAVGYQRGLPMSGSTSHRPVVGSNTLMLGSPRCAPPLWPPSTITRPSAICSMPVQKMFDGASTAVKAFVVGFQTLALKLNDWPSYISTLPFGSSAAFTDTIGMLVGPAKLPIRAGLVLAIVTATGVALPMFPALSTAVAPSVWLPLAYVVVSSAN